METSASAGIVVWLTGMSGAGKTTIARAFVEKMRSLGIASTLLDGDVLRTGLNADLGFSHEDRSENVRRVAHVAALFCNEGFVTITATISPHAEHRQTARNIIGPASFVEVFVDTPLEVCEMRDPKGLYKRARRGEVAQFTGLFAEYQPPAAPDIVVRTEDASVTQCVERIVDHLVRTHRLTSDSLQWKVPSPRYPNGPL